MRGCACNSKGPDTRFSKQGGGRSAGADSGGRPAGRPGPAVSLRRLRTFPITNSQVLQAPRSAYSSSRSTPPATTGGSFPRLGRRSPTRARRPVTEPGRSPRELAERPRLRGCFEGYLSADARAAPLEDSTMARVHARRRLDGGGAVRGPRRPSPSPGGRGHDLRGRRYRVRPEQRIVQQWGGHLRRLPHARDVEPDPLEELRRGASAGRQSVRARNPRAVSRQLRSELGEARPLADLPDSGQPRLRGSRRRSRGILRLLRGASARTPGLLLLQRRRLAPRRAELELRLGAVRREFATGGVARPRPRRRARQVPARLLPYPPLRERGQRRHPR